MKHLLKLLDLSAEEITELLNLADQLKYEHKNGIEHKHLAGKTLAMIFEKASTRTRVSFEVGVGELGGRPLYLDQSKMQIGRGETVADTAKVLSRYLHGIVIRTFSHAGVEELAREATIPVINALTDEYHPCQILADLLTIKEYSGRIDGSIKMAFYGDARSNIANSLILAARLTGMELVLCAPAEEQPEISLYQGYSNISWEPDPMKAARDVDYFSTDVWVSMGFEEERERRMKLFIPYQVNEKLFTVAKPDAKFLH